MKQKMFKYYLRPNSYNKYYINNTVQLSECSTLKNFYNHSYGTQHKLKLITEHHFRLFNNTYQTTPVLLAILKINSSIFPSSSQHSTKSARRWRE